jgi:hypothetical protein
MKTLRKKIEAFLFELELRYGWFFVNGRKQDQWLEKMKQKKKKIDEAEKN